MLPDDINKREIKVILKPSHLSVRIRNEVVIEGKLWNVLDTDSMTWTIDSKKKRLGTLKIVNNFFHSGLSVLVTIQ